LKNLSKTNDLPPLGFV